MSTKRRLIVGGSLLLACLLLSACRTAARTDTLSEVRAAGRLRIGVSDFAPWVMVDRHGKRIGFEVDVATRLARDIGVEAEFVPLPWEGLIPALTAGDIDLIAAGMSITPERALSVNFSIPYSNSEIRVLASQSTAGGRSSRAEFDDAGTTIVVNSGTTGEKAAAWAFPDAAKLAVPDQEALLLALREGRADAAVATDPTPLFAVLRHPDDLYLPLEAPLARTVEAFAVRPGDPDFLAFLDAWIRVQKAERWLERRRAYWFLSLSWESRI